MANHNAATKTNYFHVNNMEKLTKCLKKCSTANGMEISICSGNETDPDAHMFYVEDTLTGYRNNDTDPGGTDIQSFLEDLQSCLTDDDACIITEIGHEKMRYFYASSAVITKDSIDYVDLWNEAKFLAQDILGNKHWETRY